MSVVRRVEARRATSRGAVMVELVLVGGFLALLAMGAFEYGATLRSQRAVIASSRDSARALSALGNSAASDYQSLLTLRTELAAAGLVGGIERVVIYKASSADGSPPAACLNATASTELCHAISGDQLRSMAQTDVGATGCLQAAIIANFCPTTRSSANKSTADYVGIWVQVRHRFITGAFSDTGLTIRQKAVMRLEVPS